MTKRKYHTASTYAGVIILRTLLEQLFHQTNLFFNFKSELARETMNHRQIYLKTFNELNNLFPLSITTEYKANLFRHKYTESRIQKESVYRLKLILDMVLKIDYYLYYIMCLNIDNIFYTSNRNGLALYWRLSIFIASMVQLILPNFSMLFWL